MFVIFADFSKENPFKKITSWVYWTRNYWNRHFSQKLLKFLQGNWCIRFLNTPSNFTVNLSCVESFMGVTHFVVTTLWGFQVVRSVTSMNLIMPVIYVSRWMHQNTPSQQICLLFTEWNQINGLSVHICIPHAKNWECVWFHGIVLNISIWYWYNFWVFTVVLSADWQPSTVSLKVHGIWITINTSFPVATLMYFWKIDYEIHCIIFSWKGALRCDYIIQINQYFSFIWFLFMSHQRKALRHNIFIIRIFLRCSSVSLDWVTRLRLIFATCAWHHRRFPLMFSTKVGEWW